jgi:hypothetical protein
MADKQETPVREPSPPTKARFGKRLKAILSALVALGVISALSAYYLPGILKSGGSLIIKRAPIYYSATVQPITPNYVFPPSFPPAKVPASLLRNIFEGQGLNSFASWAERNGGVIVEPEVQLILRARDSSPVIINNISVRIVGQTPVKGGWFNAWDGCRGVVDVRTETVNLDRHPFAVTWSDRSSGRIKPPTLEVTNTDNEVIDVQVYTARPQIIHWVIQVSYSASNSSGILRVDNHGKPFVVTSLRNSVAYTADDSTGRLVRTASRDDGKMGSEQDYTQTC